MALSFSGSTDKVTCGSSSAIAINTGTWCTWLYPTSISVNGRIATKGVVATDGTFRYLLTASGSGGVITGEIDRATSTTLASANWSNFSTYALNTWLFVAWTFDTSGANGDQKLYMGNLTSLPVEPSSYANQRVGSGTVGAATASLVLGNKSNNNEPYPGRIANFWIFNRILTLAEIINVQFSRRTAYQPVGYWELGYNGTGTQSDWSGSGNAGTVTGSAVASHAPVAWIPIRKNWAGNFVTAAATGHPALRRLGLCPGFRPLEIGREGVMVA